MLRLGPAGKSSQPLLLVFKLCRRPWHCLACGCGISLDPGGQSGIKPCVSVFTWPFLPGHCVVLDVTPIKTNYICSDSSQTKSCSVGLGWELQHIWRGRGDTFQPITWGYRWLPSHPPLCTFYFPKAEHAQQLKEFFRFASDPGTPLLTAGERFHWNKMQSRLPGVAQALCALGMPPALLPLS